MSVNYNSGLPELGPRPKNVAPGVDVGVPTRGHLNDHQPQILNPGYALK